MLDMSSSPQAGVQLLQMDTQTSTSGPQARKRTRGPNRCIALNHQQERIVLRLNEFGQPIGASARLLSSFLGHQSIVLIGGKCLERGKRTCGELYCQNLRLPLTSNHG